jgi:cyclase
VAAVDVKGGKVAWHCGQLVSKLEPVPYARQLAEEGAGEILLTSVDREGTMDGYDLALLRAVCKEVDVPVIAHGGCRDYGDMADAIHAGASAVAAGALYQFTDATPYAAALALRGYGLEVRL